MKFSSIETYLKDIRNKRNWSCNRMAKEMGVSVSTYRSWEIYGFAPTVEKLNEALYRIGETLVLGDQSFQENSDD